MEGERFRSVPPRCVTVKAPAVASNKPLAFRSSLASKLLGWLGGFTPPSPEKFCCKFNAIYCCFTNMLKRLVHFVLFAQTLVEKCLLFCVIWYFFEY